MEGGRGQRMDELRQLANWIEQHFSLSVQPKIHNATEAEVIYAQVLYRLGGLAAETKQTIARKDAL
jgi:hypothetical protein